MSAMAQLDCGQCGYVCQTYAEALAEGRESSASLCVPGGKPTMKAMKALMADVKKAPAPAAPVPPRSRRASHRPLAALRAADGRGQRQGCAAHGASTCPALRLTLRAGRFLRRRRAATIRCWSRPACESAPPATNTCATALSAERDIARPLDRTLDLLAGAAKDPARPPRCAALADGDDGAEPDAADLLDLLRPSPPRACRSPTCSPRCRR
jgi:sulfite reductase (NADPH) flavoprotein alpha-component